VNVVHFDLGEGEDYIYSGETDYKGIHQTDTLELSESQKKLFTKTRVSDISPHHYIIRAQNFAGNISDNLDQWIYFLKNGEIKEEFHAPGLNEAREKFDRNYVSEEEISSFRGYLINLSHEASRTLTIKFEKQFAIEQGIKEGLEEGRRKDLEAAYKRRKLERTKDMKKSGVPLEHIIRLTGFSSEVIESL